MLDLILTVVSLKEVIYISSVTLCAIDLLLMYLITSERLAPKDNRKNKELRLGVTGRIQSNLVVKLAKNVIVSQLNRIPIKRLK